MNLFEIIGSLVAVLLGFAVGIKIGTAKGKNEVIARVKRLVVHGMIDFDLEEMLRRKKPTTKHQ